MPTRTNERCPDHRRGRARPSTSFVFHLLVAMFLTTAIGGCASSPRHRVQFEGGIPVQDCPDAFKDSFTVSAESLPLAGAVLPQGNNGAMGYFARRIVISTAAVGALRSATMTWSSASISTFGGTFAGWTSLQTPYAVLDVAKTPVPASAAVRPEITAAEAAAVTFHPGEIKIQRAARNDRDLSGIVSLDLILVPGGVAVDDTVVRVDQLWRPDGKPIPADKLKLEFTRARHPPGYDIVEASIEVTALLRFGRSGDEWNCTADTRATLVDEDAIRPPLWDIGIASMNGRRSKWLGLSDPANGLVRLIFDSPLAATSFATWVQAVRPTQIGPYSLGVFEPTLTRTRRSFAPLDATVKQTFRPLQIEDFAALKIGPLGEN